jgi:hypothetical protein
VCLAVRELGSEGVLKVLRWRSEMWPQGAVGRALASEVGISCGDVTS